jgi:hypothetical protein
MHCKLIIFFLSYKELKCIFLDNFIAKNAKNKTKQKKIKYTTLKYLYEIAAIPADIREKYYQKLLNCPKTEVKRKNSTSQKNVRLLEIINGYIKNDNMVEWNDEEICRKLEISPNMLYCHKHYILKGIRKYFFKWEELEKKEFNNFKEKRNHIKYEYDRACKMYDIGMLREAKIEFVKIAGLLEKMGMRNIENSIMLLKNYDKLYGYYHSQNNRYKFNIYGKKIEKLLKSLLNSKKIKNDKKLALEINILSHRYLLKKHSFRIRKQEELINIINIYKTILSDAKKISNAELAYKMYINLGVIYQDLLKFDIAKRYYEKGLKLASKFNMNQESVSSLISITAVEYLLGQSSLDYCLNKMNVLYNNFKNTNLQLFIRDRSLFQFVFITTATDRKDLLNKYLERYNSFKILAYGYKAAIRMLYFMKFTFYLNNISEYGYRNTFNKSLKPIFVKQIRQDITKKLDDLRLELPFDSNKKNIIYFTMEALMFMLQAEIFKGKRMNFNDIAVIFQKIEWLLKTRRKIYQSDNGLLEEIALLKTCYKIIECSGYSKEQILLNKYEEKFEEFLKNILNNNKENIISYFTILSYTAEQSGSKRLKDFTDNFYFKLDKKYPDIFLPIKKQIEEYIESQTSKM